MPVGSGEVVPGKLLIFKGPVDSEYMLTGESASSNMTSSRCSDILRATDVTDVVRLSAEASAIAQVVLRVVHRALHRCFARAAGGNGDVMTRSIAICFAPNKSKISSILAIRIRKN